MNQEKRRQNLNFVIAQQSRSFKENVRETRQEEDSFMDDETPNARQLKVAEVRNKVLTLSPETKGSVAALTSKLRNKHSFRANSTYVYKLKKTFKEEPFI